MRLITSLLLATCAATAAESDFSGWWSGSSLQVNETAATASPEWAALWMLAAPLAAALGCALLLAVHAISGRRS